MKPMTDLMDKMGIDEEQLEAMQEQLDGLMALEEDPNGISVDDEEEGFSAGGAATFPFLQNIFGDAFPSNAGQEKPSNSKADSKKKPEKKAKRKHLDTYCYNPVSYTHLDVYKRQGAYRYPDFGQLRSYLYHFSHRPDRRAGTPDEAFKGVSCQGT